MGLLDDRRILLCVTGGIAAYKAAELVRMMSKEGADVRVAMTEAGTKFVSPLTFQALSTREVLTDLFNQRQEAQINHIEAARWADCIVVAPATANCLGKIANGIADDLVSTILLAARCRIVVAPAMNWAMWQNEVVQKNVARVRELPRYTVVDPEPGDLACGEQGTGRLAAIGTILDHAIYASREEKDMSGEMVLVTAGPTYEDIDPVRYISNRSSGKMGFAVAREARARGARVVLIAGPHTIAPPVGVELIEVRTAQQMLEAVLEHVNGANVIVKSAAVADFKPATRNAEKIHKTDKAFSLSMTNTVDILKQLGEKKKGDQFLVGFAAETNQVMESGRKKLHDKKLDMIVVNDISQEGAGFDVDTNIVRIIDKKGHIESLPQMNKYEVAAILFDMIQKQRASMSKPQNARRASSRRGGRGGARRNAKKSAPAGNTAQKAPNQSPAQNKPEPNKPAPNKPEPNKPAPNKPEQNKPAPNKPAAKNEGPKGDAQPKPSNESKS